MFKEALATEVEHLLPSATSSALTAWVGMILKKQCIRPLQSQITCKMMKREWIWLVLAKATSWQCRFDKILNCISVFRRKVAFTSKKKKKMYTFGAPIKNKFCINLVYPCFGHRRTAKLTCEGTPGCAQSQRYPASKANAAGLLCRALEKFFLLKARNSSEKPACSKWKNRQIIVAHHPSFWRK